MLVLVVVLAAFGVCMTSGCTGPHKGQPPSAVPDRATKKLYLKMVQESAKLSSQERAAIALAEMERSDAWLVWALIAYRRIVQDVKVPYLPPERQTEIIGPEPFVVAALLRNLPDGTSIPVQLAVTEFLDETRDGSWSGKRGFFLTPTIVEYTTDPMREIARNALARLTGKDHGFDQRAWHKAILASAPQAGSGPLFVRMMPEGAATRDRRAAAAALAGAEGSAPWIVWVLSASDPFMRGEEPGKEVAMSDRAVLAALLEKLPDDAPLPVLLAVTVQLSETERGTYSTEDGLPGELSTGPIREIARDALKRITGQDHGFDAHKWRKAILKLPPRRTTD